MSEKNVRATCGAVHRKQTKLPNLRLEHIAQNHQIIGQLQSGITTKMPPRLDGPTSCFKYEELIEDWLDLAVLQVSKRGPALKNRLVGDAENVQNTS